MQPEPVGVKTYLLPLIENGWLDRSSVQSRSGAFGLNYLSSQNKLADQCNQQFSSIVPFEKWLTQRPTTDHLIGIVASAAWGNKRWPLVHFQALMESISRAVPSSRFVLFGGPDDGFARALTDSARLSADRIYDGIGKWSLVESSQVVQRTHLMVGNDTGLMHMAERLMVPAVFLVGPTAFGYPVENTSRVLEVNNSELRCKPCSKDGSRTCTNRVHMKCMWDLTPQTVLQSAIELLNGQSQGGIGISHSVSTRESQIQTHPKKDL